MNVSIVTIGTEILFGQIDNSNSRYLSDELNANGFDVLYHFTVGDNSERLKDIIETALERSDIVITTGGLGPTQDDITKQTIAEKFGDELVLHDATLKRIEEYFKRLGKPMTSNNVRQAYLPSNSKILENEVGSAIGFIIEREGRIVASLPGPPRETRHMFKEKLLPLIKEKSEGTIYYRNVKTIGIGESQLETELLDIIEAQKDVTIAPYASEGEAYLRVAAKKKDKQTAEEAIERIIESIVERVGDFVYSTKSEELGQVLISRLREKKLKISSAESCTGGMFADSIIRYEGASDVFDSCLVTYSNEAKMHHLGITESLLKEKGAVSEEVALQMAEGLYEHSKSDICISVTGIAGPGGGSREKPVGLVYVGIKAFGERLCFKKQFENVSRDYIRKRTVSYMQMEIFRLLKSKS